MARRGFLSAALSVACLACAAEPESSAGFRLPGGDPVRGQKAFIQLRCHSCHRVVGLELPEPAANSPALVAIGGEIATPLEDGEVMTSIINPSHQIAPAFRPEGGDRSPMADLTEAMTVQQLVDLVAFVRSRYTVASPGEERE